MGITSGSERSSWQIVPVTLCLNSKGRHCDKQKGAGHDLLTESSCLRGQNNQESFESKDQLCGVRD